MVCLKVCIVALPVGIANIAIVPITVAATVSVDAHDTEVVVQAVTVQVPLYVAGVAPLIDITAPTA